MTIPIDLQVLSKRRIRIAVWHHRKTAHNVSMGKLANCVVATYLQGSHIHAYGVLYISYILGTAILDPSAPGILSAVLSSPDKTIREWIVLSG